MKKVFALILALVMVLSLSGIALAATIEGVGNSANTDVNIVYTPAGAARYNVEITWDALTFTYNANQGEWDPEHHTYSGTAGWANEGKVTFYVKNHSDAGITALAAFNSNGLAETDPVNGVVAKVYSGAPGTNTITLGSAAEGASLGDPTKAPSGTFTVEVTGEPTVESGFKMDTLIITIYAAP